MCQRTGLNVQFSVDCLQGNNWDFGQAVSNFEQVKVRAIASRTQRVFGFFALPDRDFLYLRECSITPPFFLGDFTTGGILVIALPCPLDDRLTSGTHNSHHTQPSPHLPYLRSPSLFTHTRSRGVRHMSEGYPLPQFEHPKPKDHGKYHI